MTSYSHLQTHVLAKFVDTTCIFRGVGAAVGKQSHYHVELLGAHPPKENSKAPKLNYEALQIGGVFINFQNVKPPYRIRVSITVEGSGNL